MSDIFKISKDEKRANALVDMAKNRYLTLNELK